MGLDANKLFWMLSVALKLSQIFGAEQNALTVQRDLSTRVEPQQQQLSLNQHDTRCRPNTWAN